MMEDSEPAVANPKALKILGLATEPKMGGSKKPGFATGMTHQYDVVSEQTEVGLANIKHFFKFLDKLTECMPQDFNKAVRGMTPLEGDMMCQYDDARSQTESLVLACLAREREMFTTLSEHVVKPLAAFHAKNLRQKRVLDADLIKCAKALKDAKQQLKKEEAECKIELEKYLRMHSTQLELRLQTKEAVQGESTYERFLSGEELEAFKQTQSTANADAAAKASPLYADYRKQRKKTFELFNKYDVTLQEARSAQLKFHEFLTGFLAELESMERFRLKTIDVYARKLANLFEAQSKFMQETVEGLQAGADSIHCLDEQQLQHALRVWDFLYGASPPFESIEYRLPCKANDVMDDYRTSFETCPRPTAKKAYIPPHHEPPEFSCQLAPRRIKVAASGRLQGDFATTQAALIAEHGPMLDFTEWPFNWETAGALKSWRVVAAFKQFLELEFNAENLNFWLAVNRYRAEIGTMSYERQLARTVWIYGEFVAEGGPEEVPIPKHMKADVKKVVDEAELKQKEGKADDRGPDLADVFNVAQECIFRMLGESYERFKQTKSFRWLRRAARSGDDVSEEQACTSCGRMLIAGNSENICITCRILRTQPMIVMPHQSNNDETDDDSPTAANAQQAADPPPTKALDIESLALKSDLEALRSEYEALKIRFTQAQEAKRKPETPKAKPSEKPMRPEKGKTDYSKDTKVEPAAPVSAMAKPEARPERPASPKPDVKSKFAAPGKPEKPETPNHKSAKLENVPPKPNLPAPALPAKVAEARAAEAKTQAPPIESTPKLSIVQQMKLQSELREREAQATRVDKTLAKGEFYCSGCNTLMKSEDNWCIECGLPRVKAKASKN